jgi:predicted metalloendopeptidase
MVILVQLGEALGKLYCVKYFDESCKERAYAIVEQVRQALEDRLKEVDWMKSEDTRKNALKKMERFGVKVSLKFHLVRTNSAYSNTHKLCKCSQMICLDWLP